MADLTNMLQAAAAGGSVEGWDLSTAVNNSGPYELTVSNAQYIQSGIHFKPDGTRFVMTSSFTNTVFQRDLPSAWTFAIYASTPSPASVGISSTAGIYVSPDGTNLYVTISTTDNVDQYSLSTAWDVSTASFVRSFYVGTQDSIPQGLFFKPDGTKMYVTGQANDTIYQYNLSTAWDISTASYSTSKDVSAQTASPSPIVISSDGLNMYLLTGTTVYQYSLGTAWDVSTASYSQSASFTTVAPFNIAGSWNGLYFRSNGTELYLQDGFGGRIGKFTLTTAWDISTGVSFALPTSGYFYVGNQESIPTGMFFSTDGTKMYVIGTSGDDVNQYSLSTAWDVATASYVQNFSIAAQETNPSSIFFSPDGTNMYVMGTTGDDVNQYSLGTAWDVSTASYVRVKSISAQDTSPQGLFFSPDGTDMYVLGSSGDDVNQYSLSTAWDVSTATYVQNFSIVAQHTAPTGLFFKPDGTKMYITGSTTDVVSEYDLSTAWDISTASFVQNLGISLYSLSPQDLFFKPDGTKLYILDNTTDAIVVYDLG